MPACRSITISDSATSTPLDDHEDGGTEAPASSAIPVHFKTYVEHLKKIPALSRDQQDELQKMRHDPEEPPEARDWARQTLWTDSLKFVLYVRMRLRGSLPFVRLDDMDILQEGNLAAGAALATWDPARGTLATWLYPHVRGALLNHAGAEAAAELPTLSLDAVVDSDSSSEVLEHMPGSDGDDPLTLGEMLVYDRHVFDDPEVITEYGQVRRTLLEQHGPGWGDLAADYLIGETNVRELAAKYGVTVPTVYNRMRKMGF